MASMRGRPLPVLGRARGRDASTILEWDDEVVVPRFGFRSRQPSTTRRRPPGPRLRADGAPDALHRRRGRPRRHGGADPSLGRAGLATRCRSRGPAAATSASRISPSTVTTRAPSSRRSSAGSCAGEVDGEAGLADDRAMLRRAVPPNRPKPYLLESWRLRFARRRVPARIRRIERYSAADVAASRPGPIASSARAFCRLGPSQRSSIDNRLVFPPGNHGHVPRSWLRRGKKFFLPAPIDSKPHK